MTISWIKDRMPCGCAVREFAPEGGYDIEYCPKHKAAPEMYEALKAALKLFLEQYEIMLGSYPNYGEWPEIEMAKQALAKAEGKS